MLKQGLRTLIQDESGQDMVEYALIIGLVAIALAVTIAGMNGAFAGVIDRVGALMRNV